MLPFSGDIQHCLVSSMEQVFDKHGKKKGWVYKLGSFEPGLLKAKPEILSLYQYSTVGEKKTSF